MALGRFKTAARCAAVFVFTLIAYVPAIRGGRLWNDGDYLTAPGLRSLVGLWRIWSDLGATQQYYPVLHTLFWIEHLLWGGWLPGYHVTTLLLHAGAACLFAFVLKEILGPEREGVAWCGALLFALHPVCVESVAWISEEKNTLSTFFYLASALAYLRWSEAHVRAPRGYLWASLFFFLALFSKTVTASLPAALLVVLWWKRGKIKRQRDVVPLLPWFVAGLAASALSSWVERRLIGAEGPDFALSLVQRFLVAAQAVVFYAGKLAWPTSLTFIYPKWRPDPSVSWQWAFPVVLVVVAAGLWILRKRSRGPWAAFLFYVGSLFPLLGFFNFYGSIYSFVADHWQYLPSLGVFAAVAIGGNALLERIGASSVARTTVALVLSAGLGILTWRQCGQYRDQESLYTATLARNPDCWMAYNNLGILRMGEGRAREAAELFEKSLRAEPDYFEAHYNLANALAHLGRGVEAVREYAEALRIRPGYSDAHDNLANTLAGLGRMDEALAEYDEALRLNPDNAEAHNNLGNKLAQLGRYKEALDHYRKALALNPSYPEAHNNLGNALARSGQLSQAAAEYRLALRIRPAYPEAHTGLANALVKLGEVPDGLAHYEEALRINPSYAEAHLDLAIALADLPGRLPDAIDQAKLALTDRPNLTAAREVLDALELKAAETRIAP